MYLTNPSFENEEFKEIKSLHRFVVTQGYVDFFDTCEPEKLTHTKNGNPLYVIIHHHQNTVKASHNSLFDEAVIKINMNSERCKRRNTFKMENESVK